MDPEVTPLVEPGWLHSRIEEKRVDMRILDCTFNHLGIGDAAFNSEHIEGALFLNVLRARNETDIIPMQFPDPESFQDYAREVGINEDTHIIIYENVDEHGYSGPRTWWMFRVFGHMKVSVLNGGLKRWKALGYPVTSEQSVYERGNFTVKFNKEMIVSFEEIHNESTRPSQLLDARGNELFQGQEQEPSFILKLILDAFKLDKNINIATGHVGGSKNLQYPDLFNTQDDVTFKSPAELRKLFEDAGIDLSKDLTTCCYVGLTACQLALAAAVCGNSGVRIYVGSWLEYGQRTYMKRNESSL